MSAPVARRLVLASTSTYRAGLLARLGLAFDAADPAVDETAGEGDDPTALARRLARAKADAIHGRRPGDWVIGADQVAVLDGGLIGKPGARSRAAAQLRRASGRCVGFHTAVCVLGPGGWERGHVDVTQVRFCALDEARIDRYLAREPALDCAGSFKVEGLGITLLESVESRDPTALVGLPLIALASMLREAGFELP